MARKRFNVIKPRTKRAILPNAVDGTPTWHNYIETRKVRVRVPVLGDDKLDVAAVNAAFKDFDKSKTEDEFKAFSMLMTKLRTLDRGIEDDGDGVREWRHEVVNGHFFQCEATKTERMWGADECAA